MTFLLSAALLAPAADPTPDDRSKADAAIHAYLAAETERVEKNFFAGARTRAEWEAKRPALQTQFLDMLGLWPLPEKTPLKAVTTGTLERDGTVIEKVCFQSKPGLYVTANLYRPKVVEKKLPAVLYLCGHSNRGRDGNKTAFQDHGRWFAANGYVCLVVDTLQLGEVAGKHHGTYNLGRFWWHSRGYTPAGVECWNGIRAIDYLCGRPEVDADRIGVTGISGGGATTVWVMAADDRVKAAVPVSGMSDLSSYVTDRVIDGHCDCMFGYNPYRWAWATIPALFAPKPLLFANSDADPIFPMPGNRRIVARLREGYELLGAKDNVEEYVSPGGHDYRPDLRVAVFGFLNKHLKGAVGDVKDADFPKIDGKDLRVFPEDADLPKDAINDKVDEVFVPAAEVTPPAKAEEYAGWKAGLVKRLKDGPFRALPPATAKAEGRCGKRTASGYEQCEYYPEDGIACPVFRREKGGDGWITLVVLNPDEDWEREVGYWAERFPGDVARVVMYPRGGGPMRWTRKNPPNTVERSFPLLGSTVDTGRVWDAWSASSHRLGGSLRVVGRGQAGVIGAYAAHFAFAKTGARLIDEVVILDPPASHRDGPQFLGVQRVLDIPDALGLLAPDVKLTLIGAKDPAFDRTAAIYKLAGADGKFERK